MKKLYSKFTKERGKAFQIETAIWEKEDGEREVTKRPLSAASRGHVAKMYENFRWFEESGFLLPCRQKDDMVIFPFITGKSYYNSLMEAISRKDRGAFLEVLQKYKVLMDSLYPERSPMKKDPEFERIFGLADPFLGMEAVARLNIDLTFVNILGQGRRSRLSITNGSLISRFRSSIRCTGLCMRCASRTEISLLILSGKKKFMERWAFPRKNVSCFSI